LARYSLDTGQFTGSSAEFRFFIWTSGNCRVQSQDWRDCRATIVSRNDARNIKNTVIANEVKQSPKSCVECNEATPKTLRQTQTDCRAAVAARNDGSF
jgi:hypothetical protein